MKQNQYRPICPFISSADKAVYCDEIERCALHVKDSNADTVSCAIFVLFEEIKCN